MKTEGMVRQEHILEAAIRRFSHFGIQKTTLTEVADDLSMTKQALLYYFSDKQSLIAAVQEKITTDYIQALNEATHKANSVEETLLNLIDVKKEFFEKYFMLANQFRSTDTIIANKEISKVKQQLQLREQEVLSTLFQKGMSTGELKQLDAVKTAGLLLDTLTAFTFCISDKKGLPDAKDFEVLFTKQKEVLHIFYNGLKG